MKWLTVLIQPGHINTLSVLFRGWGGHVHSGYVGYDIWPTRHVLWHGILWKITWVYHDNKMKLSVRWYGIHFLLKGELCNILDVTDASCFLLPSTYKYTRKSTPTCRLLHWLTHHTNTSFSKSSSGYIKFHTLIISCNTCTCQYHILHNRLCTSQYDAPVYQRHIMWFVKKKMLSHNSSQSIYINVRNPSDTCQFPSLMSELYQNVVPPNIPVRTPCMVMQALSESLKCTCHQAYTVGY